MISGGRGPSVRAWDVASFDARRKTGGVTLEQLAHKTGLSERTVRRALKSQSAKPAVIKQLRVALRALLITDKNLHMFEVFDDA